VFDAPHLARGVRPWFAVVIVADGLVDCYCFEK